jgi:uncharacterized protein (TIGR03118 family)
MNKIKSIALQRPAFLLLAFIALFSIPSCKKYNGESSSAADDVGMKKNQSNKKVGHFTQVNLVANTTGYNAARIDPTLINAWGLAFSASGIAWVSSQGGHVSDVYNSEGGTVLGPVNIPLPAAPEGGNPTGVVLNPNPATDFPIPGGGARFIFVGVDGVVSAWNPAAATHAFRKTFVPGSAFTGLTIANNGGSNFLYAADFRAGRIAVWDKNWNAVTMPFMDPNIPAGYSPYNIQNIDGWLYVTYAKVASNGRSEAGVGKGFVDIYDTQGTLVKRFASMGQLNAPWGLTMAPVSFFKDDMDDEDSDGHGHGNQPVLLVGNFGDGRINAYRADGKFLGQLRGEHDPLTIDGLWAIRFPPSTSTIDPNRLYFNAGPDNETDGIFGYIMTEKEDDLH